MRSVFWGALVLFLLSASGCIRNTRGAVKNATAAPITVMLKDKKGKTHAFAEIPPNSTTAFSKLPFDEDDMTNIQVEIVKGAARAGQVGLKYTFDNVIVLHESEPPQLDAQENSSNTFW